MFYEDNDKDGDNSVSSTKSPDIPLYRYCKDTMWVNSSLGIPVILLIITVPTPGFLPLWWPDSEKTSFLESLYSSHLSDGGISHSSLVSLSLCLSFFVFLCPSLSLFPVFLLPVPPPSPSSDLYPFHLFLLLCLQGLNWIELLVLNDFLEYIVFLFSVTNIKRGDVVSETLLKLWTI